MNNGHHQVNDNIFFQYGIYHQINLFSFILQKSSRIEDLWIEDLSLKNFIEKLRPTCKAIVLNIIYRSDNGKTSLTVKKM